jgi:hypothetical protein
MRQDKDKRRTRQDKRRQHQTTPIQDKTTSQDSIKATNTNLRFRQNVTPGFKNQLLRVVTKHVVMKLSHEQYFGSLNGRRLQERFKGHFGAKRILDKQPFGGYLCVRSTKIEEGKGRRAKQFHSDKTFVGFGFMVCLIFCFCSVSDLKVQSKNKK